MALLEVRDLIVEYGTTSGPLRAVDGVSFDVHEGRALGIIGESGSGKTSLALTLMRLLPRNATLLSGTMRVGDEDLGTLSDETFRRTVRWSRMAMVSQGAMHSLNPVIRVGDQVGERLSADGVAKPVVRARVDELLARVGLPASTASRGTPATRSAIRVRTRSGRSSTIRRKTSNSTRFSASSGAAIAAEVRSHSWPRSLKAGNGSSCPSTVTRSRPVERGTVSVSGKRSQRKVPETRCVPRSSQTRGSPPAAVTTRGFPDALPSCGQWLASPGSGLQPGA
jgi:hypothetical protein